jgi:uncharacterized protein (TIGR02145 family)
MNHLQHKPNCCHNFSFLRNGLLLIYCFMVVGCSEEAVEPPSVSIGLITNISGNSASVSAQVIFDGNSMVSDRGILLGDEPQVTFLHTKVSNGTGMGVFETSLNNLYPGKRYYLKAYAVNAAGVSFSEEKSFTTTAAVTDIDGNIYTSVSIGSQTWLKENLKVSRFCNGDEIPYVPDPDTWAKLAENIYWGAAYTYYNNDASYNTRYGKLYNWYPTIDSRGLCPTGWHIPNELEWETLLTFLGGHAEAGGKLKTVGTTDWLAPNVGASDQSGFSGLPGGWRLNDGTYQAISILGLWWSTTESEGDFPPSYTAKALLLVYENGTAWNINENYSWLKGDGLSCRCLKD